MSCTTISVSKKASAETACLNANSKSSSRINKYQRKITRTCRIFSTNNIHISMQIHVGLWTILSVLSVISHSGLVRFCIKQCKLDLQFAQKEATQNTQLLTSMHNNPYLRILIDYRNRSWNAYRISCEIGPQRRFFVPSHDLGANSAPHSGLSRSYSYFLQVLVEDF